ncbi:sensor histidine kinase [Pontiella sp.]|uniref:sensor histidine kinase n=1 Tax=Pontiella sp. TaxID=2837462 RepID=UPI003561F473
MISIRFHLLATLLPAFAAISIAAGFGVYYSTKAELGARLDTRLANYAVDLRFTPPQPERDGGGGMRNRFNAGERDTKRPRMSEFMETGRSRAGLMQLSATLFTNLPSTVYCEISMGSRDTIVKTDNLENNQISRPPPIGDEPVFYDATLANGVQLRAWASKLSIVRDTRHPLVILAVSRDEIDVTLARLASILIGGGIACCLILSLLLIVSLRVSLRPLSKLGEQAATMDAESLHERFSEESAPSDIRPIIGRLNDLMAKLEESFARERRFSGDLAHELRTPLAAIRTTSEVALKWPDQASAEDFEEIHKLSSGLQQTLDSLLLLSRMESSAAEKARESVDPATIAEECRALHAPRAAEHGLRIEFDSSQAAGLETDPRMLRIIMANLIGNAVEYAPEGSVVTIAVGGAALFQCANDAPNLAPDDVPRLFERMWRKDKARTESGHAGLGLSIAKACADTLGFELVAELDDGGRLHIALRS